MLCVVKVPFEVFPASDEVVVDTGGDVRILVPEVVGTWFVEGLCEFAVRIDLHKDRTLGLFVLKESALMHVLLSSFFGLKFHFLLAEGLLPLSLCSSWCT